LTSTLKVTFAKTAILSTNTTKENKQTIPNMAFKLKATAPIFKPNTGKDTDTDKDTDTITTINNNPHGFIKDLRNNTTTDETAQIKQFCFCDVSGSQATDFSYQPYVTPPRKGAIDTLRELFAIMDPTGTAITCIPFGRQDGRYTTMTTPEFRAKYANDNAFNCGTYTAYIAQALNYLCAKGERFHFILQGDGAFSDPGRLCNLFEKLARENKLKLIAQVTIVFSGHTTDSDQLRIVDSLTKICMNSVDIIPVVAHRITNVYANALPGERKPLVQADLEFIKTQIHENKTLNSVKTPDNHFRVSHFAIHKLLTAASIAKVLRDNEQGAKEIYEILKENARLCPTLLTENAVYARIYKVCCILFGKAASDWLGDMITNPNTPIATRTALQQMRDNSKQDSNEVTLNMMKLNQDIIGYLTFGNTGVTTKHDVLAALKDLRTMSDLIKKVFKTANPAITPVEHGMPSGKIPGFPILKKGASIANCKLAMQNMLAQYGDFTFSGLTMYVVGLAAMFSDAQVPNVVYEQLKKTLFVDLQTTMQYLGVNPDTCEWNVDTRNKLMDPSICKLVAEALLTFGDKILPGCNLSTGPAHDAPAIEKLAYDVYQDIIGTYRVYKQYGFVSRHASYKVKFMRAAGNVELREGMIGLVQPYNEDPQRNLPSWVIIRRVGRNKRTLRVQYFDRVLTETYTDEYRMPVAKFTPYRAIDSLTEEQQAWVFAEFNAAMCKIQQDGANGKLGPDMLMGAALNQQVLNAQFISSLQMLDAIATRINTYVAREPYNMEEAMRDMTREEMVNIISGPAAMPPALIAFLKTGNKPNSKDLDNGKVAFGRSICGDITKLAKVNIDSQLQQRVREDFAKHLAFKPPACLQVGRFWDCTVCLDSFRIGMGVVLSCGHAQCNECHNLMRDYVPQCGDQVNMSMCRCAVCRKPMDDSRLLQTIGNMFDNLQQDEYPMRCSIADCASPYYIAHLGCGGDESQLVRTCEIHSPKPVAPLPSQTCPGCEHTIERTSGCDFMRCHCGAYFCFGCGMKLEYNHGDWSCKGSQTECAEADEHPGWESD
jgi:hypothetical protein